MQRLPPAHTERDYLRLDEIPRYLDGCSGSYRPIAELLVGSGLRISEVLTLRVSDLELEETGGAVVVYRSRKNECGARRGRDLLEGPCRRLQMTPSPRRRWGASVRASPRERPPRAPRSRGSDSTPPSTP